MTERRVEREIELPTDVSAVWRMLSDATQLSAWFGTQVSLEARRGGRATFVWPDGRQREAVIEMIEPERFLMLRWLPFERDHAGRLSQRAPGTIRFRLQPADGGTRLGVTETVAGGETNILV